MQLSIFYLYCVFIVHKCCHSKNIPIVSEKVSDGNGNSEKHSIDTDSILCESVNCKRFGKAVLKNMDTSASPCEDFYKFTCGNFEKQHPIPLDKNKVTTLGVLNDQVRHQLKDLLEEPFSFSDHISAQMAKIFYKSCINEAAIDELDLKPLLSLAEKIGRWPVVDESWSAANYSWEANYGNLRALTGIEGIISITIFEDPKDSLRRVLWIDQGSLGLGSRHYYEEGQNSTAMQAYKKYMVDRAVMFGANNSDAEEQMQEIIDMEYRILNISTPPELQLNYSETYNLMTLDQLKAEVPNVNWDAALTAIQDVDGVDIPDNAPIFNVAGLEYLKQIDYVLNSTAKRTLANYFMGKVMGAYTEYLPKKYRKPYQEFRETLYEIQKDRTRWELCVSVVEAYLPWQIARAYVEKHFRKNAKQEMDSLVKTLLKVMKQNLKKSKWMDKSTRKHALRKLKHMGQNIGYPDYIFNETKINQDFYDIPLSTETFFDNFIFLKQKKLEKNFKSLMVPVDKSEWETTPNVVNAYYSLTQNEIIFPAGILQFPVFSPGIPKYANFGGIGMIIGHEITHGYDKQGRQFGPNGNLQSWWDDATLDKFSDRADCFENQYGSINDTVAKIKLNGKSTLGENIADNGGIRIAYKAYKKWTRAKNVKVEPNLPGLQNFTNDQMFFISFANGWCQGYRPKGLTEAIKNSRHSIGKYRVNVSLQNLPGFSKAFKCKSGSKMNPRKKCRFANYHVICEWPPGRISHESDKSIAFESRIHNDILQTSIMESYESLPLKTLASLQWVSENCPKASFVLKCDDDTFVFPDHLRNFMAARSKDFKFPPETAIYGHCVSRAKPVREINVKWAVDKETFPGDVYPDFCSGTAYLMSGDLPNKLVDAAYKYRGTYLHIEDVTFTGILADSIRVPRITHPGFIANWLPVDRTCRNRNLMTVHRVKSPRDLKTYAAECFGNRLKKS